MPEVPHELSAAERLNRSERARAERCLWVEKIVRVSFPQLKAYWQVRVSEIKPEYAYRINVYSEPSEALVPVRKHLWSTFMAWVDTGWTYSPGWPQCVPR